MAATQTQPNERELVYCRNCDTPLHPPVTCPTCLEPCLSARQLFNLLAEKRAALDTLAAEISAIRAEQHFRKLRNGERYFWEQPRPSLRLTRPTKRPAVQIIKPVDLSGLAGQACLSDLDF